jgi:peptide chain release factor 1
MINVAVLPLPPEKQSNLLSEDEIEITTQTGHGKGGQHQNKTASAVRMVHKKTGLNVFINGRDQHTNRREALRILSAKVNDHLYSHQKTAYTDERKEQLGDGNRGGKVRTYSFIEKTVVDHRTGKRANIKDVMKGNFGLLYEKNKIYSYKLEDAIIAQIPKEILDALASKGWNVFGIYELVQEEIKKEKKEKS